MCPKLFFFKKKFFSSEAGVDLKSCIRSCVYILINFDYSKISSILKNSTGILIPISCVYTALSLLVHVN